MFFGLTLSITPATKAEAALETKISFDEATPVLNYYDQNSYIFALEKMSDGVLYQTAVCSGWDDPKCRDGSYTANVIFPVCKTITDQNCIEYLEVTSEKVFDGTSKLIKTLNPNGLASLKLTSPKGDYQDVKPSGSGLSLFEVPSLTAAGEVSKFAVKVRISFSQDGSRAFSATVIPYSDGNTGYSDPEVKEGDISNVPGKKNIYASNGDPRCVWSEKGACGIETSFPKGAKIKLSIRVGDFFTPWLHGRLVEPSFDFTDIDVLQKRLTITAKPAVISGVSANIAIAENLKVLQSALCPPMYRGAFCSGDPATDIPRFVNQNGNRYSDSGWTSPFKIFELLEKFFPSRASSSKETWFFKTVPLSSYPTLSICANQKTKSPFLGVINTNAIVYDAGGLKFKDGYLDYTVGGVRSNPDGSDFMGTYDLVLNGEFARCLFGLGEKVPVSATVSIVSNDTESKVQTTFFKDDGKWIRFGAYGFTFSSPTFKVKLTQDPSAVAVQTPTPSVESKVQEVKPTQTVTTQAIKPVATKKTITCIKGKTSKKLTGLNPKCPAGYKKK